MTPRGMAFFAVASVGLALSVSSPAAAHAEPEPANTVTSAAHKGDGAAAGEEEDQAFNWAYGFLGEKDGVEPSLLYRPKGAPPPFLANILNAAIFFGLLFKFGKQPVVDGLKKRKERIVHGMEEAGKMKAHAVARLGEHEEKIAHLDREIERIKLEMREAAEAERGRILSDAKERRERMERDAKLLVEQELKAAREMLVAETVASAMKAAEALIAKDVAPTDHDRIAKEYLEGLRGKSSGRGGGVLL